MSTKIDKELKTVPRSRTLESPEHVASSSNACSYQKYFATSGPGVFPRNLFFPQDFESAKQYLSQEISSRNIIQKLPPKFPREKLDSLATPLLSRTKSAVSSMLCHGCHGPVGDGAHQGSSTGKNLCRLPHHGLCPGEVIDSESWRACPFGYVQGQTSVDGFEQTMRSESEHVFSTPHNPDQPYLRQTLHGQLQEQLQQQTGHLAAGGVPTGTQVSDQTQTGLATLPQQQQHVGEQVAGGSQPVSAHSQLDPLWTERLRPRQNVDYNEVAEDLTLSQTQKVQEQVSDLRSLNQAANLATAQRSNVQDINQTGTINDLRQNPALKARVEDQIRTIRGDIPALSSAQSAPPQIGTIPKSSHLQSAPQHLPGSGNFFQPAQPFSHVLNQQTQILRPQVTIQQPQLNTPLNPTQTPNVSYVQTPQPSNLYMGQPQYFQQPQQQSVRVQPAQPNQPMPVNSHGYNLHPQQQQFIQQQVLNPQQFQQQPVVQQQVTQQQVAQSNPGGYQYPHMVRPPLLSGQQVHHSGSQSQVFTPVQPSVHDNIPVRQAVAPDGQSFTPVYDYFVGSDGVPYKVLRQPQPTAIPQTKIEYRCRPDTGELYQVQVPVTPVPPVQGNFHQQLAGRQFQYSGHNTDLNQGLPWQSGQRQSHQLSQGVSSTAAGSNQSMSRQIQDSVQGIVNIVENRGAAKTVKLLDYVKRCPAKWAKDSTIKTINLAVYGYAAISELEAGLTGKAESLSTADFIAKMNHIKSVFEVCCLNSSAQDFTGYGWTLARDYATKVENKVDQNVTSWQEMPKGVQTGDLLLAQCEYPRPPPKIEFKKDSKKEQEKPTTRFCTTFNSCTTLDKCEYEVANPDKICQRKHECSYCRKHFKQGFKHQELKCSKKANGIVGS